MHLSAARYFKGYTFGCIAEAMQYRSLDIEGWLGKIYEEANKILSMTFTEFTFGQKSLSYIL
ncbi:hypothetical protein SAMN04488008_105189 [Maribacter orientalis]|uniref:Uncharacterized protein n=1 Tax=Maribacter orientalis TaxID=228957 RepID=A0A1H7T0P6_9FLAO|nr:hypothetical protein SAMN04488008_105189 [Maribacter orientalis]